MSLPRCLSFGSACSAGSSLRPPRSCKRGKDLACSCIAAVPGAHCRSQACMEHRRQMDVCGLDNIKGGRQHEAFIVLLPTIIPGNGLACPDACWEGPG